MKKEGGAGEGTSVSFSESGHGREDVVEQQGATAAESSLSSNSGLLTSLNTAGASALDAKKLEHLLASDHPGLALLAMSRVNAKMKGDFAPEVQADVDWAFAQADENNNGRLDPGEEFDNALKRIGFIIPCAAQAEFHTADTNPADGHLTPTEFHALMNTQHRGRGGGNLDQVKFLCL